MAINLILKFNPSNPKQIKSLPLPTSPKAIVGKLLPIGPFHPTNPRQPASSRQQPNNQAKKLSLISSRLPSGEKCPNAAARRRLPQFTSRPGPLHPQFVVEQRWKIFQFHLIFQFNLERASEELFLSSSEQTSSSEAKAKSSLVCPAVSILQPRSVCSWMGKPVRIGTQTSRGWRRSAQNLKHKTFLI